MRIKAMLATHDIAEEAMPWMEDVRAIFDELVIFIDEKRVTPGTVARAKKVGTRVHYHKADKWYQWDLAAMARACESDWIFNIERDEQLSPEWRQDEWRGLLEKTSLTHFWVPRRWVVPLGEYITADPWWPDLQLRLLRNGVPGTTFPKRLHDAIHVPGPGGTLRDLTIHHHVLWLCAREVRESRVRYYEQLRPGGGLGHYYLYEDYSPPQTSLPTPEKWDVNCEILRMDILPRERISELSMKVKAAPREVIVSEMFWLDVELTNATTEPIYSCPPFPVRLAYHWIQETTRLMVVFDGERSGRFPLLVDANEVVCCRITVMAPNRPGRYILQTTMLQENICWFENMRPEILQEFPVSVIAGTHHNTVSSSRGVSNQESI
jgi:hypothetical protein